MFSMNTFYFDTKFLLEYLKGPVWLLVPFCLVHSGIFVFRNFFLVNLIDDL